MSRAPRFWGPRAYSFSRIFCSLFRRGTQTNIMHSRYIFFLGYYLFWNLSIAIYYIMQYQAVSLSYAPYDIIADTHCVTQDTTRVYW
jgi:hypothetical protein